MTEATGSHSAETRSTTDDTEHTLVRLGTEVGVILAIIALVVGLAMAFHRRVAPCPNGHTFPQGTTDFRCFVYPQAGEGSAVAMFAVMLGIIIVLSSVTAIATLNSRPTADRE